MANESNDTLEGGGFGTVQLVSHLKINASPSGTKAFILPVLSDTQIAALLNQQLGMLVFSSTQNKMEVYTGSGTGTGATTNWEIVTSA